MRFIPSGRARRAAFGGTAVAVLVGLTACDYLPDGDQDVVAFAGSDTTQDVVTELIDSYNADPNYNNHKDVPGDDRDILDNILSVEANPNAVAADEHCAARTYHTPAGPGEVLAPNGSTAGRDALKASVLAGDGCIDVARSSSGPRAIGTGAGQDPASFEYYAFGLDAVGWSSASAAAPQNLTLAQLRGIYNCTFTNWNQVGGTNQAIRRYYRRPVRGRGRSSRATCSASTRSRSAAAAARCPWRSRRTRARRSRLPTVRPPSCRTPARTGSPWPTT
jgi:phosphate transport system substrate-binding protein